MFNFGILSLIRLDTTCTRVILNVQGEAFHDDVNHERGRFPGHATLWQRDVRSPEAKWYCVQVAR